MTAFLKRIAFALGLQKREEPESDLVADLERAKSQVEGVIASNDKLRGLLNAYLSDFGPNVPVEDLGGKPVYFENNQPVFPGREKAP